MDQLRALGFSTIRELETARGVLASGKEEIYGCIFGRDSLITALKLLRAYERSHEEYFLSLVKKILLNLADLQGKEVNLESGEEPGKIIHEFRETKHEHLTARQERPWYLYPDKKMRNYDSVDSTPLFLIAVARYWEASGDDETRSALRPAIEAALAWVRGKLKTDERGFLTYAFPPERVCGGLTTQSWMDSHESLFHEDGSPTPYPIAPAEAQAYAFLALSLWGHNIDAVELKQRFNKGFVLTDNGFEVAFALDGNSVPMRSLRSSIGHILWASHELETILEDQYIPKLVELLMSPELFVPEAGIRTLSTASRTFDPHSYHNGSIWPHDTAIVAEGLARHGYEAEASRVRESLFRAWSHFNTPIELFVYTDKGYDEYHSSSGQRACLKQAWSAASMLAEL